MYLAVLSGGVAGGKPPTRVRCSEGSQRFGSTDATPDPRCIFLPATPSPCPQSATTPFQALPTWGGERVRSVGTLARERRVAVDRISAAQHTEAAVNDQPYDDVQPEQGEQHAAALDRRGSLAPGTGTQWRSTLPDSRRWRSRCHSWRSSPRSEIGRFASKPRTRGRLNGGSFTGIRSRIDVRCGRARPPPGWTSRGQRSGRMKRHLSVHVFTDTEIELFQGLGAPLALGSVTNEHQP